jgi:hypothetical protein
MVKGQPIRILVLTWTLLALLSCSTTSQFKEGNDFYKRDLIMEINDSVYDGIAIVDSSKLKLKATFKGNADLVWIKSCARSLEIEQAWKTRAFGSINKNKAKINIDLQYPLETNEYCPIEITGLNHEGIHTYGFIDIKTKESLPARVVCNGQVKFNKGVSVCQNFKNLLNEIEFTEPVKYKGDCNVERIDESKFRFSHNKGYCSVVFKSLDVNDCNDENIKRCHRLTHLAYESVILKQ